MRSAARPRGGNVHIIPSVGRSIDQYEIIVEDVYDYYQEWYNEPLLYTFSFKNDMESDDNIGTQCQIERSRSFMFVLYYYYDIYTGAYCANW